MFLRAEVCTFWRLHQKPQVFSSILRSASEPDMSPCGTHLTKLAALKGQQTYSEDIFNGHSRKYSTEER